MFIYAIIADKVLGEKDFSKVREPRLKAEVWVKAHLRRCQVNFLDAYLRHRGDRDAGGILLKINQFSNGSVLLEPTMAMTGGRAWMRTTGPEPVADAQVEEMIAKRLAFDGDLWVIEVEDPDGRHALDDPIV